MFLISGPQEWLSNFFVDSMNFIFTNILDLILYGVMGMLFKVYLLIGSFDLFGGFSDGTEAAMKIYQDFSNRLYGALGIIVMFILAYQIILFIIDPDKGIKQSKQLVTNLVKALILVILCPLIFHYAAVFQHHFLVEDNVVWRMMLGTTSQSKNVKEAGNAVPSMIYVMMFHPAATSYDDFYDTEGKLKSVDTACANYDTATAEAEVSDDSFSLGKLIKGGFTVAFHLIMPEVALAIDASSFVIGLIKDYVEGNIKLSTCEYYYTMLYYFGQKDPSKPGNKDELHALTDYNESTIGYHNMAMVLAADTVLSAEIYPENEMEYYHFSPVAAVAIIIFLFGYTLDIAHRAFKLAFLQMIAPVPILLGVIPKNEKLYSDWKSTIIKTYLEIFVRTFVFAFIIMMIQLLPTFLKAMISAWDFEDGPGLTQCIAFLMLIIGLLRFGQELPKLVSDFMKNSSGIFAGIDLNPINSMKKSKAAIDATGKPIGAVAGGAAGMISARNAVAAKGGGTLDKFLAGARGLQTGAKSGYASGMTKGAINNSMKSANTIAINDMGERHKRAEDWKKDKGAFLDGITQGRLGDFQSLITGQTNGTEDSLLFQAANRFQTTSNGIIQTFDKAGAAAKADAVVRQRNATDKIVQNEDGTWSTKFGHTELKANSEKELNGMIKAAYDNEIRNAEIGKLNKEIQVLGTDGITKMAASTRKLYSQDFDALGKDLQNYLKSEAENSKYEVNANGERVVKDSFKELEKLLVKANNDKPIDFSNAEEISRIIETKDFQNRYNDIADKNLKDQINDGISTYYRDVARAGESVAQHVSNEKGFSSGTEINRYTGRSVNNLGSKPDKK